MGKIIKFAKLISLPAKENKLKRDCENLREEYAQACSLYGARSQEAGAVFRKLRLSQQELNGLYADTEGQQAA